MTKPLNTDILKAVSVRYVVNPELERKDAVETEEMCQKTIATLKMLDEVRPRLVLMADPQNKRDPHAVMIRALGEKVAYVEKDFAPDIRGMLKEAPRGMLITTITDVVVYKHGYFHIKKPTIGRAYTPEEIGVDWGNYQISEPFILPNEYFDSHDELTMVIDDELLPDLANVSVEELRLYIDRWLTSVRYNQSREVYDEMQRFISILAADSREEVRRIAIDVDHLRTKKGTSEVIKEMTEIWWHGILHDPMANESFSLIRQRCQNERHQLLLLLDKVEELMRHMPGELYNDVGDAYDFFSHLAYLAPPMSALSGVLSLLAIRTLICEELTLPTAPFFGKRVEVVADVKQMPTTIDKVMEFAEKQCKEYVEVLTVQRLVDHLRQDYLGMRDEQVEGIINAVKPATNISVGKNCVPCSGNIQEPTVLEKEYESPVYLTKDPRGFKIDMIRVIYVLFKLGFFTGKDGRDTTKKRVFTAIGRALNLDLSTYDSDLSRSLSDSTALEKHLRIFDRMKEKMKEVFDGYGGK